jgi:hypothetical protein
MMSNPYEPSPSNQKLHTKSTRVLAWPTLAIGFGAVLLVMSLGSILFIGYLVLRYQELDDPTTRPERYWPKISVLVHAILGFVSGAVGLPIFVIARRVYRRRAALLLQAESDGRPVSDAAVPNADEH